MSHSSRDHPSRSHQSPEERQGPAPQRISPSICLRLGQVIRAGMPSRTLTVANTGGRKIRRAVTAPRSEEHTSELQSRGHLVCRLLLEKKKLSIILTVGGSTPP